MNATAGLDRMFEALADPTRRALVERLSRGPASVSELASPFPISLPAVVQHLQLLEQSGLITSEKIGRTRTCSIDAAGLGQVEQWVNLQRVSWQKRLDRLAQLLETDEDTKD